MTGGETGRIAWRGIAAWSVAAAGFFFAWVLRVSPSVMIEPIMAEFDVGAALLGTLSGLYFYTYAILQAPAGLAILDSKLRYVQLNETLARMNGRTVGAHLGKSVCEVLPELAPVVEPILQRILATGEPALTSR